MRKGLIVFIIFAIVLMLLVIALVSGKFIFLWSGVYKSNSSLDDVTNKEIKSLLLNVLKDRHSTIFTMNKSELYTEEYRLEYMQSDNSSAAKSMFISIDSDFMESVKKTDENEYKIEVQLKWPDDWRYYFTVKAINGRYFISYLEIDP